MPVLTKFWEGVGSGLGERWIAASLPVLAIVLVAASVMRTSHEGRQQLEDAGDAFSRAGTPVQAALLLAVFALAGALALVVERTTSPVLHVLEGYGWPIPAVVYLRLIRRIDDRCAASRTTYQELAARKESGAATAVERARLAKLEVELRRIPAEGERMPTRIGNILRAAERRPGTKYGLDAISVWPHLWLVMPGNVRDELTTAREMVDRAVAAGIWPLLLLPFAHYAWWVIPLSIASSVLITAIWLPPAVEVFADLFEASFDLYRSQLYIQLRWPLPARPADEKASGALLTRYLWRGPSGTEPQFTAPPAAETSAGH